jgi:hypothetical protein
VLRITQDAVLFENDSLVHRTLKVIYNEKNKQSVNIQNLSNTLYIMQGIQRFTEHEKDSGEGFSFSVIFRQLTPYTGQAPRKVQFNERVQIDWTHGLVPRAWRICPYTSNHPVGTKFSLREFNKRRLHPVPMCSISCRNSRANSIVLYSEQNIVSASGKKVYFIGYPTANNRSMGFNNVMLATHKVSLIAVYKKLRDKKRQFLGNFYVDKVITLQQRMYFALAKYE